MKTFVSHQFVKCALVLALGCWVTRAENQTNAVAKFAPALIKSEFVADTKAGRPQKSAKHQQVLDEM